MLVPSQKLLLKWIDSYNVVWERIYGHPRRPQYLGPTDLPDPNSVDVADIAAWLQYYDIYLKDFFPGLLYFDSWEHALQLLAETDLAAVARRMHVHNRAEFSRIASRWVSLLERARKPTKRARAVGALKLRHAPKNATLAGELWRQYSIDPSSVPC